MTTVASNSILTYSTTKGIMLNGNSVTAWPLKINANVTLTFGSFLVIDFSATQYFTMNGANATIDGLYNNIYVNNVANFGGLCFNPDSTYANCTVQNFGVIAIGTTTLATFSAWIIANWSPRTAIVGIVQNCFSTGDITTFSAGICNGSLYITCKNCYSRGNQIGSSSGGIVGNSFYGNVINCYSTGNMQNSSCGGILGSSSSGNATNCHSTGNITNGNGGIYAWASTGNATNCYSTGNITSGGGIYAYSCPGNATNCYSTGNITNNGGGIYSYGCAGNATNCYSTGNITSSGGGIYAYDCSGNATNCYVSGSVSANSYDIATTGYTGKITNCWSLTKYYP